MKSLLKKISNIRGRDGIKMATQNAGYLLVDKILRMGMGLFVGVWVARYLGPEQFGIYSFALAFVALFSAFSTLGLDGIVVRDIVREPQQKNKILGSAFALRILGAIFALCLAILIIFLQRPNDIIIHWLVGITAAGNIFAAFDTIDLWFQSQLKSKFTVYSKNASFLFIALIKIILILMRAPLIAFAWAGIAEIFLGALGLIAFYQIEGQLFAAWRLSLATAINLLKDSWPLILSSLSIMVYMKIDQIMLGSMIGNSAVGIYSAALRISEVWYFIPSIIVTSVFPTIVRTKQIDEDLYYKRLGNLYGFLIWMAIGLAVPFSFFSGRIVTILYGAKYAQANIILSIHIWTAVFVFYGVAKGIFIQCENMQLFSFICTTSGAVSNIMLNLYLIRGFGVVGAAFATLSSQIISAIVIPSFYRRDRISVKLFFGSLLLPFKMIKST